MATVYEVLLYPRWGHRLYHLVLQRGNWCSEMVGSFSKVLSLESSIVNFRISDQPSGQSEGNHVAAPHGPAYPLCPSSSWILPVTQGSYLSGARAALSNWKLSAILPLGSLLSHWESRHWLRFLQGWMEAGLLTLLCHMDLVLCVPDPVVCCPGSL